MRNAALHQRLFQAAWARLLNLPRGALICALLLLAPLPARPQESPAQILQVQVQQAGEATEVRFTLSKPVRFSGVANLPMEVVVVKFEGLSPILPAGGQDALFNHFLVAGVALEEINPRASWVKIRLRKPAQTYQLIGASPSDTVVVKILPAKPSASLVLESLRLEPHRGGTRVVASMDRVPRFSVKQGKHSVTLELANTSAGKGLRPGQQDAQVKVSSIRQNGKNLVIEITPKTPLSAKGFSLASPPRVVVELSPPQTRQTQAERGIQPPVSSEPAPETMASLLAKEPNAKLRDLYIKADRAEQNGERRKAQAMFLEIYKQSPKGILGVRSYFRAIDIEFDLTPNTPGGNFHSLILSYQAAIRGAEQTGFSADLIPRALLRVGQSYQRMAFLEDARVQYTLLQKQHPANVPYTADSHYHMGEVLVSLGEPEDAIEEFHRFIQSDGDPKKIPLAYYQTGDAYYNMKNFPEARREFDEGYHLDPSYVEKNPLVLFHMGETYYESADFNKAKEMYLKLLRLHPDKAYAYLVALRLGDMFREEGKEEDALKLYQAVLKGGPPELQTRGKMRVANLLALHEEGDDYKKALDIYRDVVKTEPQEALAQEARLRAALTLSLHGDHLLAIRAFEELREKHPKSPYLRANVVEDNISENLKGLIDKFHDAQDDLKVVNTYTGFKDTYFRKFPYRTTLFKVADSYARMGLFKEAQAILEEIAQGPDDTLNSLAHYRTIHILMDQDKLGQAEDRMLDYIASRDKKDFYMADVRMELGEVYLKGRRFPEASNAYRILINENEATPTPELGEAVPEAWYRLGTIYRELGQTKQAAEAFDNVLPNFNHPITGRGVESFVMSTQFFQASALDEMNQDEDAIKAYQAFYDKYPDHEKAPWALYQIGLIHRRNNRDPEALEMFNQLVALSKKRPGEMWETLAKENQRDLTNLLKYREYMNQ
ncbi:MAG: tetratricopeptide repeat protein [Deltaproteobacteria bacterium]|nr:tetratricopeptide repeat protein [Deltaproteobacteria bacterium]MDH4121993.1 tetratricopeptide repeat protein [Deltaproteobacteria bacterium]